METKKKERIKRWAGLLIGLALGTMVFFVFGCKDFNAEKDAKERAVKELEVAAANLHFQLIGRVYESRYCTPELFKVTVDSVQYLLFVGPESLAMIKHK